MLSRLRDPRLKVLFAVLMTLAILGACGSDDEGGATDTAADDTASDETDTEESPAEDAAAGGTLEFAATEYAFSAPATVPAGQTSITLVNNGEEPHILSLAPLTEDAPSVEELLKLPQKKAESFFAGKPIDIDPPVKPGETSAAVDAELVAGRYGYVCFYSEKGEKPHAFLGMHGELTVE